MFLTDLFEATTKKILVIYPGRFQIFHHGHYMVYQHLCEKYGEGNVYVVTSNKVDPPKSPFDFGEKLAMMTLTGVDSNHIVQEAQPYQAKGLVSNFDPKSTILIFAVSEKDMAEDPRFKSWVKKDGSPAYFQPLTELKKCKTLDQHGYIATVPTFNFEVLGKPANSATQIREQFANADETTQKAIVTDLFGKFSPSVLKIMQNKLTPVVAECGGVGVVKNSKDPRYSMGTTCDVKGNTLGKEMKAFGLVGEDTVTELKVTTDQTPDEKGDYPWGLTGNNANIDYMGVRVDMKPSVFLKLAKTLRIGPDQEANIKAMADRIKAGGTFGAPMLYIEAPDEWRDGDFTKPAKVYGHEGRHRCNAQIEAEGNTPIEVHLILRGEAIEWRNRHINQEVIARLNQSMIAEYGMEWQGPFFTVI